MPTKIEKDAITGTETTGHEWDGIKELNTPLPRWWLYVFAACVVWAIGYMILYPSWPSLSGHTDGLLNWSMRAEIVDRMAEARAAQKTFYDQIEASTVEQIQSDPELLNFALAGGRAAFADNCAPCHGAGGAGAKGYPNLADDDWLWGGDLETIYTTVRYGIRADNEDTRVSDMPRFGADELLEPDEIDAVADYVLSLSSGKPIERGADIFAENCAACHGEKGEGGREFGAPRLSDGIWLYGGDKKTVVETITNARRGVMPAWIGRLDGSTLKMVAVYVHGLGGGE